MMWTTSRRSLQLSTADRARPSGGKRRPRLSTPCCDQRRLALRWPVETEQYVSIRCTERLADAGIELSVGSVGDSYDNALAETVNGLYKTEVHLSGWAVASNLLGFRGDDDAEGRPVWNVY